MVVGRTQPTVVTRVHHGGDQLATERVADVLVVEEPLSIQLDGRLVTTTMRTPGHDFELAAGFCFTDGLLAGAPVTDVRYVPGPDRSAAASVAGDLDPVGMVDAADNIVTVDTDGRAPTPRPRLGNVSSSCGWCGSDQLDDLCLRLGPIAPSSPIDLDVLAAVPATVRSRQELFGVTGAVHAAAVFDRDGRIIVVREDVGRHNAVDKVIGSMLLDGRLPLPRSRSLRQRPGEHRDGPEGVGSRTRDAAGRERSDDARRRVSASSGDDTGRVPSSGRLQHLFAGRHVTRRSSRRPTRSDSGTSPRTDVSPRLRHPS